MKMSWLNLRNQSKHYLLSWSALANSNIINVFGKVYSVVVNFLSNSKEVYMENIIIF